MSTTLYNSASSGPTVPAGGIWIFSVTPANSFPPGTDTINAVLSGNTTGLILTGVPLEMIGPASSIYYFTIPSNYVGSFTLTLGTNGSSNTYGIPISQSVFHVSIGALNVPPAADVISPTLFGLNNGSTGTAIMPFASQVQEGVAFGPDANNATLGTLGIGGAEPSHAFEIGAQQVNASTTIYYGIVMPNSPIALLARVSSDIAVYLQPSTVATITAVVTDMKAGTVGSSLSIDPIASTFSTLQLNGWLMDSLGYNLAIRLAGSNFPSSNTTYQVVASILTTDGVTFTVAWQLQTDDVM